MRSLGRIKLVLVLILLLSIPAYASTQTRVDIMQSVQTGERLSIIFDVEDENGDPVSGLNADNVAVSIGTETLKPTLSMVKDSILGIGYVFAIDISKSLTETQFESVRTSLNDWISSMGENDQAAMMTFGTDINILTDFTKEKTALVSLVEGISPTDMDTQLYNGTSKAIDLAKRQSPDLPLQRVIVILTDAKDDYPSGATLGEVQEKMDESGVPVYVVGLQTETNEADLNSLGSLVRSSGGELYFASKNALSDGFTDVYSRIQNGYLATIPLSDKTADGSVQSVAVSVEQSGITIEDSDDIRLKSITVSSAETITSPTDLKVMSPKNDFFNTTSIIIIVGVLVICATAVLIIKKRTDSRRNEKKNNTEELFEVPIMKRQAFMADACQNNSAQNGATERLGGTVMLKDEYEDATIPLSYRGGDRLKLMLTDTRSGKTYAAYLGKRIQIGRKVTENDIAINDGTVSGKHCVFELKDDQLILRDLNSSNGTYIMDGNRRKEIDKALGVQIRKGDLILIGETELEVDISQE